MSFSRSVLKFSLGTFGSRIVGLIRERVVAHVFGAGMAMDALNLAYSIPNMFRDMLAEGALNAAFTKAYSHWHTIDRERAQRLLHHSFSLVILVAVIFSLIGSVFSPAFADLFLYLRKESMGTDDVYVATTNLLRIFFPFVGFMIIGGVTSGVLHEKGRFLLSACSPMMFNVGYLLGAMVFAQLSVQFAPDIIAVWFKDKALFGLAVGICLGGFLQVFIQFLGMVREIKGWWSSSLFPFSDDMKLMLKSMVPAIIAGGGGQVNFFVNTNFASSLQEEGSVTVLRNAFRIYQLPIGIFAVGIGMVVLPQVSRLVAKGGVGPKASKQIAQAISASMWILLPIAVVCCAASYELISIIFEGGQYTTEAAQRAGSVLFYFGMGLVFYGWVKILMPVYMAVDRISFAMKASFFAMIINLIANSLLVKTYGVQGLAMTSSIVMGVNSLILLFGLRKQIARDLPLLHSRFWLTILPCVGLSYFISVGYSSWCEAVIRGLGLGFELHYFSLLCRLGGVGLISVSTFAIGASLYYRLSPRELLRQLAGQLRRKKQL